jgi:hypothetical protein
LKNAPHRVAVNLRWQARDIVPKGIFEGESRAFERAVGHQPMYQMSNLVSKPQRRPAP